MPCTIASSRLVARPRRILEIWCGEQYVLGHCLCPTVAGGCPRSGQEGPRTGKTKLDGAGWVALVCYSDKLLNARDNIECCKLSPDERGSRAVGC